MEERKMDPVVIEVIRAAIPAICDEMAVVLRRAAYNMFIYEVQDYSVAMMDPSGNLLGQNRGGNPAFLGDLGPAIQSGIADIGEGNFHPGDIIVLNQHEVCGQHLNNVIVYQPVFFEETLTGFTVARGHWMDIGGSKVGLGIMRTVDIWQEGLQFRNIKAYEGGQPNRTFFQMVQDNLRRPDLALGDLRAQIAACRLGERRFVELLQHFGMKTVVDAVKVIADQAEVRARQAVANIPDGVYEAESFLDNDGIDLEKTVPVKVRVVVSGEEMTVDFSEMSPQLQGPMNSGFGGFLVARVAFKALTSPSDPPNEGCFRPLKVIAPPGKMISARRGAPMASWSMGLSTVLDTIYKALAPALPDKIVAGQKDDQGEYSFYGIDPETGNYWFCGNIRGGGWGGRPGLDGVSGLCNYLQAEVTAAPIELQEQVYPLLIEEHRIVPDTGGAGKFRGGLGTEWRIRPFGVDDLFVNISHERSKCPPWGLWGGKEAVPSHAFLDMGDGAGYQPSGKRPGVRISGRARTSFHSGGGGGWGDPLDRDTERVLNDVLDGYVSLERARSDYGVVIDLAQERVDEAATEALRAQLRQGVGER